MATNFHTTMLQAESQAGMWVRNGVLMHGQTTYYTCPQFCAHTFQLDISALQLAACAIPGQESGEKGAAIEGRRRGGGGEQLVMTLLERFRLLNWVCGGVHDGGERRERSPLEADKMVTLLSELLALIIMILCERGLVAPSRSVIENCVVW